MVVCMSERREGHNAMRRQTMKRWKVALVAVLTIAMVMQSSNVQAIAEGFAEGLTGDRPLMTDTMLTDGTGTDEATGTDAATGTEDVTTDEATEDTTSTEATTPETDEAATDTEATEEESTDAPAAPEEVVEDTTEAEAPAEEADTTVTLNVEISGAKLTYPAEDGTEQNVTPETDPKSVDVPNTLDFKFTVIPDDGQQIASVKAVTSDGAESDVTANESGEYTLPAANVTDGTTIKVTTEAVPETEETAEEEATAEDEKTPESDAEKNVTPEDETKVEETAPSASNGISTLSISGQKQVAIGETIRLSSDSPASSGGWRPKTYTHKWTASPSNAVSFSNTSNSGADVTGNHAGTVTINHEWGYDGWFGWQKEGSETYTITVYQADEEDLCTITFDTNGGSWNNSLNGTHKFLMGHELWPEGQDLSVPTRNGYVFEGWTPAVSRVVSDDATYTAQWKQVGSNLTPVYVYLQVNGDTSGLILNYSGWYTVGVIYMPSNLVSNTGIHQDQTVNLNDQRVAQALDEAMKSIVRYGPNESLVIDDATWTKLHVQAGANDYVAEGPAWHLDGEIDAKYLANLTVKHIDMDTQEIMRTDTSVRTVGTSVNPGDMVRSFKNYTYDHSEPNHAITIQKNGENVINIYYQKNADRLFYDANGGEGTMSPSVGKAEEQVTVKENGFTRDGYEFTGWNTKANGSGKDYDPGDKYTLTDGEDKLFAQWKQVIFPGTPITVQVEKDGEHISADGVVKATEYEAGGGTADFKSTLNDHGNLNITYTYDNLNCADIALDINVPEGYDVEVVSDKINDTVGEVDSSKVAKFKLNGSGDSWTLDNTPGGATVTVKLTKKEFTVSYKADNGGRVSKDSETVKYGEDAEGSAATPNEGYYFVNWTNEEGIEVSTDATFAPKDVKENATYTAHFAKKMEVSITGKSATDLVYNGSEQSVSGFVGEAADGVPVNVDGQTYYVKGATSTASGTNAMDEAANTTVNTEKVQVVDANGNDVTDRFTVTVNPGQFKINKRDVELTANSATKVYDGTALTDSGYKITSGSFVGEEGLASVTVEGSITDPGDEPNVIKGHELKDGTLADNYNITYKPGNLHVDKVTAEIVITADSNHKTYDGTALTDDGYTYTQGVLAEGDELTAVVEGSATNVSDGRVANKVTSYKVMRGETDVTANYTFGDSVDGELYIEPVELTVKANDASKVYDGTMLTNETYEVISGSFIEGETYGVDFGDSGQTVVGVSENNVTVVFAGEGNDYTAQASNYSLTVVPGTLQVFPQSIDPSDPDPDNPEPGDPDPSDPDPENPDQPFYTGVSVDSPSDVVYDGADHTWTPTVTDGDGNVLVANRDYTVSYSTIDRTNVTGTITVTITGTGNFAGTVTRTYQVVPRPLVVQANDQTKVQGAADPALSSGYNPAQLVAGEEPGWTGGLTREAGEAVGTYAITQGTLALEDNGDFLAANYVLTVLPGTLTITAAPAPDNPPATTDDGGDDTPTTPAGPTNPVPDDTLPVTDDATTDDATPEETVTDDENPLASGDEEGIEDNGNPLASGRGDEDCWVHWLILVGMILTAVYFVGVAVRRRKFTADLLDYEDKVLGNNRNDA